MKDFFRKPAFYIIIIIILLILLFLKSCGSGSGFLGIGSDSTTNTKTLGNTKYANSRNKILNTAKSQTDVKKPLCKENLYAIGRKGAGVFLAVGDSGIAFTSYNGGLNWKHQNKIVKGKLYGAAVLNQDTLIAVGQWGTIIRTTNHGINWDSINSGTKKNIKAVSFPDRINGIAVGDSGLILKTNNAGHTWTNISISPPVFLNSVCFVNANTGWFSGNGGVILKSTDFGATCPPETTTTVQNLNSISFNNEFTGTAVGDGGTILNTNDGGHHWLLAASHSPVRKLNCVHRVSNVLSYIAGIGLVVREDKGVLTNLDTDTAHKFNAVDPGQYITDIAVGNNGITMAITTSACDDCNVNGNNDLMFIPPGADETNWQVRLRVYSQYTHKQYMRFISPGFLLDQALNGWTEMDGSSQNHESLADVSSTTNGNYNTTSALLTSREYVDAITLDMKTNNSGYIYFSFSPLSNNTDSTGTFEFYFGDCVTNIFSPGCSLSNDGNLQFCHKVTYSLSLKQQ